MLPEDLCDECIREISDERDMERAVRKLVARAHSGDKLAGVAMAKYAPPGMAERKVCRKHIEAHLFHERARLERARGNVEQLQRLLETT